jgi:hypothetical protein
MLIVLGLSIMYSSPPKLYSRSVTTGDHIPLPNCSELISQEMSYTQLNVHNFVASVFIQ